MVRASYLFSLMNFLKFQTSTSVHLLHAKTGPRVWILLEVIDVIVRLDTLAATVKQVKTYFFSKCRWIEFLEQSISCTLFIIKKRFKKEVVDRYFL